MMGIIMREIETSFSSGPNQGRHPFFKLKCSNNK